MHVYLLLTLISILQKHSKTLQIS